MTGMEISPSVRQDRVHPIEMHRRLNLQLWKISVVIVLVAGLWLAYPSPQNKQTNKINFQIFPETLKFLQVLFEEND